MSAYLSKAIRHPREPSACGWCGISRRDHARRWVAECGWHAWAMPHQQQIKARMLVRRTNPNRWIPRDGRTEYRKWKT